MAVISQCHWALSEYLLIFIHFKHSWLPWKPGWQNVEVIGFCTCANDAISHGCLQ